MIACFDNLKLQGLELSLVLLSQSNRYRMYERAAGRSQYHSKRPASMAYVEQSAAAKSQKVKSCRKKANKGLVVVLLMTTLLKQV